MGLDPPGAQNSHNLEGQGSNPNSIGQREAFGIHSLCLYLLISNQAVPWAA